MHAVEDQWVEWTQNSSMPRHCMAILLFKRATRATKLKRRSATVLLLCSNYFTGKICSFQPPGRIVHRRRIIIIIE
jgi:hypothetical protein